MPRRLTIITGAGALVPHVVAVARQQGGAFQILSVSQAGWQPGATAMSLRDPAAIFGAVQEFATTHLCFVGAVHMSDADREGIVAAAGGPESALGDSRLADVVAGFAERLGIQLVGAHELAPDLVAGAGQVAGPLPDFATRGALKRALQRVRAAGVMDLGQAGVFSGDRLVALEDIAGTDALLERVGTYRDRGLVADGTSRLIFAKASKPGQPVYVDLPVIGPRTIELVAGAGIGLVVIEANRTLLVNRDAIVEVAQKRDVSITAIAGDG
jgi:DUF1009 family protein